MITAIEALLDDMVGAGWANESDGDVESPTGYFARISNTPAEVAEILVEFEAVTGEYGVPHPADLIGHFLVTYDSLGFVHIERYRSEAALVKVYRALEGEFAKWFDTEDTFSF